MRIYEILVENAAHGRLLFQIATKMAKQIMQSPETYFSGKAAKSVANVVGYGAKIEGIPDDFKKTTIFFIPVTHHETETEAHGRTYMDNAYKMPVIELSPDILPYDYADPEYTDANIAHLSSVISHELRHALDLILQQDRQATSYWSNPKDPDNEYYSIPAEINAFFQQVLHDVAQDLERTPKLSFQKAWKYAQGYYFDQEALADLPDKIQQRLKTRLYKFVKHLVDTKTTEN